MAVAAKHPDRLGSVGMTSWLRRSRRGVDNRSQFARFGLTPSLPSLNEHHRRALRQPAFRASASEQNQRSPFEVSIRVRS